MNKWGLLDFSLAVYWLFVIIFCAYGIALYYVKVQYFWMIFQLILVIVNFYWLEKYFKWRHIQQGEDNDNDKREN